MSASSTDSPSAELHGIAAASGVGTVLVTGGAGFFGELLIKALLARHIRCVSIDLETDNVKHPLLTSIRGDIRDTQLLEQLASRERFDTIFHLAAIQAHDARDKSFLWSSNVQGTVTIAEIAKKFGIPRVVYTSTNCLWGKGMNRPVTEMDQPEPVEIYGRSKWEGEKILLAYREFFHSIIFRCPTIIDSGRLGLLAILFEFIDEGRKVWVVDGGKNRYQFIYAPDLVDACLKGMQYDDSALFNIGSDGVTTFAETYEYVISKAGTGAHLASMPGALILPLMKLAHLCNLSPLGPYQYKMIAAEFEFDTGKIKKCLSWLPTLTNREMLFKAYTYYHEHRKEIQRRSGVSAHKRSPRMGAIRLLKWLS